MQIYNASQLKDNHALLLSPIKLARLAAWRSITTARLRPAQRSKRGRLTCKGMLVSAWR